MHMFVWFYLPEERDRHQSSSQEEAGKSISESGATAPPYSRGTDKCTSTHGQPEPDCSWKSFQKQPIRQMKAEPNNHFSVPFVPPRAPLPISPWTHQSICWTILASFHKGSTIYFFYIYVSSFSWEHQKKYHPTWFLFSNRMKQKFKLQIGGERHLASEEMGEMLMSLYHLAEESWGD